MANPTGELSRGRVAPHRAPSIQQGRGCGHPFRRDRDGRSTLKSRLPWPKRWRRPAAGPGSTRRSILAPSRRKRGSCQRTADAFLAECRSVHGLEITGLMCIPPVDDQASPHFALLAQIAARNAISTLSMGMSADFELGIQLGATHVRVGSAIFGGR